MKNKRTYEFYKKGLEEYQKSTGFIFDGLDTDDKKDVFLKQLVDSHRRVSFVFEIQKRELSNERINPLSDIYDPLRAAVLLKKENINEAFWNIFMYVLFGKNYKTGYKLIAGFYSKNQSKSLWSWNYTKDNLNELKDWFIENLDDLKKCGNFGNHRKYQSLRVDAKTGNTYNNILSYFEIIGDDHNSFIDKIDDDIRKDKFLLFDHLYNKFQAIQGFSRLSVFDYLCMIGKIGLINIEPDNTYLLGSTGPTNGAKILFNLPNETSSNLNYYLTDFGNSLIHQVPFIMQILEDAICNWQKSPDKYIYFRG